MGADMPAATSATARPPTPRIIQPSADALATAIAVAYDMTRQMGPYLTVDKGEGTNAERIAKAHAKLIGDMAAEMIKPRH